MYGRIQKFVMAVAAIGAIAVGSAVIANAASDSSGGGSSGAAAPAAQPPGGGNGTAGPGPGETLLTGETADKVTQAAKDKVSGGTVLRVETDADGSPYEAHVRKSDGTEVVVKVGKDFEVTAVEDFGGPRGTP